MDDSAALKEVVLERAGSLARQRLGNIPWDDIKAGQNELEKRIYAVYLDGVRDGRISWGICSRRGRRLEVISCFRTEAAEEGIDDEIFISQTRIS